MCRQTAKLAFDKIASTGTKRGNLLILHGLFGSKANFRSLARRPEMSAERDVYLVDLRNHGESEHKMSMQVDDMARDIERFMDDQGLDKAVILGHSMGGKAAMKSAFNLQKRVEGLVVGDVGPFNYVNFSLNNTMILDLMIEMDLKKLGTKDAIHKQFMEKLNGNKLVSDFLMTNIVHDHEGYLKWRINVPALFSNYQEYSSFVPESTERYLGPTMVIYGSRSEYMPKERFPEFKKFFPNIDLAKDFKEINGGHWIHFADPEGFLKYMDSFLKTLPK